MKIWLKENWFKLLVAIAILVAALAMGYYYAIFVPKFEQQKYNDAQLQKASNNALNAQMRSDLFSCLIAAEGDYKTNWNQECIDEGKLSGCDTILRVRANDIMKVQQDEKNECYKLYPQN